MVKAKELKKDDKISIENINLVVSKIDVSKIAKHGKAKCRIEGTDTKKQKKIFIVLADQEIKKL
ncbi:MAG: hypothetical protein AABW41_02935 [Nanoarchaeota archaeon]